MKKKLISIAILLVITITPVVAQVFLDDDDYYGNRATSDPSLIINNPGVYGSGEDWYAPLGSGVLLFVGMAGVYLVKKKENKTDKE